MASGTVFVTVKLRNRETLESLVDAQELVEEICESTPWCEEAKEALEKLTHVLHNIEYVNGDASGG